MNSVRPAFLAFSIVLLSIATASLWAEPTPLKISAAIAAQQRLIDASPTDSALYNDLGNLLFVDGQNTAAEEAYERSIELNPPNWSRFDTTSRCCCSKQSDPGEQRESTSGS